MYISTRNSTRHQNIFTVSIPSIILSEFTGFVHLSEGTRCIDF